MCIKEQKRKQMKNYKFYINKYYLITGLVLMIFTSCNDEILKETPLDFLAPEVAYTSVEGIQQGINGLHTQVRANYYYGYNDTQTQMYGLGTDLAFMGEDPSSTRWLNDYPVFLRPDNPWSSWAWNNEYNQIQRANVLIKSIEESSDEIWESEAQKNALMAEAMFFRAFSYRILTTFYGDVPLVKEPVNSAKTDFVRAPKEEVYDLMKDDLLFGTVNLPEPGEEKAPGRITQGAAWTILSELYITMGENQLAVDAASQVIDGYNYQLMTQRFGTKLGNDIFGSGDVYFDLFGFGNHNLTENTEAIWVIQIEPLITGGGTNTGERAWGPAYFRLGNTPDGFPGIRGEFVNGIYTGYSDTLGRSVGWFCPTNYLKYDIWQSDWDNDIRNAEHNIKRNFYYDNPNSQYHGKKIDFSLYPAGSRDSQKDTCSYIFPYWMKFADPLNHFTDEARSGGGNNHKDIYALRLPETILLRAEAYLNLGERELAAADINIIRNRANATPVTPAEVDIDYILDERARELYGEEFRNMTLRRVGKLVERTKEFNNNPKIPGANIQEHHILYPIPQAAIDLNINATIEQNPGY